MSAPNGFDPKDPTHPRPRVILISGARERMAAADDEAVMLLPGYFIDADTGFLVHGHQLAGDRCRTWSLPFEMPRA